MNTFTELRSEEVQELLARPPKALLRWSITVVFGVLVLVFAGAWAVHYPDLVRASFKLTSANAPKVILARTEGKIVRLFVRDGQAVKAGAVLAYLESTARHEEVLRLSQQLTKAWTVASRGASRPGNLEGLSRIKLSGYNQLGELQNAYQTFEQTHIHYGLTWLMAFTARKRPCSNRKSSTCRHWPTTCVSNSRFRRATATWPKRTMPFSSS